MRDRFPLSRAFGSGYTSRGEQRYVFTWNTSSRWRGSQRSRRPGVRTMANLKPCLLNDHRPMRGLRRRGFVRDAATGKPVRSVSGTAGRPRLHPPSRQGMVAERRQTTVLGFGIDTAWNDNNESTRSGAKGQSHGGMAISSPSLIVLAPCMRC